VDINQFVFSVTILNMKHKGSAYQQEFTYIM